MSDEVDVTRRVYGKQVVSGKRREVIPQKLLVNAFANPNEVNNEQGKKQ
jgi:hypothetical protein